MGRSRTWTYSLRFQCDRGIHTPHEWKIKQDGKPTVANIEKWVRMFEMSCEPNGVNRHLGRTTVISAFIVDQRTGRSVVRWLRQSQPEN